MRLKLLRTTFTDRSTIGELFVDEAFECFTLEDMVRPVKIPGMTAIPAGSYVVSVSFSSRFKRLLPEIHDVPQFTGVRIHPGNTDADTEGCILVGKTKAADFIGNSRAAFNKLFERIQAAAQREKIFLEITSGAQAPAGLGGLARAAAGLTDAPPAPARLALVRRASSRKSVSPRLRAARSSRAPSKAKRGSRKAKRRPKGRRR